MNADVERRLAEARELLKPWAAWANLDIPEELMTSGRYSPNDARFHYAVSEVMRVLGVPGASEVAGTALPEFSSDAHGMWSWRCNGGPGCVGWVGHGEHSEAAARSAWEDHVQREHVGEAGQ